MELYWMMLICLSPVLINFFQKEICLKSERIVMKSNIKELRDKFKEYYYFYGEDFALEYLTDDNVLNLSEFFLDMTVHISMSLKGIILIIWK